MLLHLAIIKVILFKLVEVIHLITSIIITTISSSILNVIKWRIIFQFIIFIITLVLLLFILVTNLLIISFKLIITESNYFVIELLDYH